MTLSLAIATAGTEGIRRVASMLLPLQEGVSYVVSWQRHGFTDIPAALKRDDVEVYRYDVPGLSNNRNNALRHCSSDIVLFADDDVTYRKDAFSKIRKFFEKCPDVDVALFRADYPFKKSYPEKATVLKLPFPRNYYPASIEIAFQRERIGDLKLSPLLGLGAPEMTAGEDEFFIISAIKRGLKCMFVPVTICTHPDTPTGESTPTEGQIMASGAIIRAANPHTGPLRLLLQARRLSRLHPLSNPNPDSPNPPTPLSGPSILRLLRLGASKLPTLFRL